MYQGIRGSSRGVSVFKIYLNPMICGGTFFFFFFRENNLSYMARNTKCANIF